MGKLLADLGRMEEAAQSLSHGLLNIVSSQLLLAAGYMTIYMEAKKYQEVIDVARWVEASMDAVRLPGQINSNDKILSGYVALAAFAYLQMGDPGSAKEALARTRKIALSFDAAPSYAANRIRFVSIENATAYDDYGATALEGLEQLVKEQTSPAFSVLWEEVQHEKPNQATAEDLHRSEPAEKRPGPAGRRGHRGPGRPDRLPGVQRHPGSEGPDPDRGHPRPG